MPMDESRKCRVSAWPLFLPLQCSEGRKGETRQAPMAVRHCPVYSPSPANRISPAKLYLWGTPSKYSASTWRWATAHPPKLIGPASSAGEEFPRFPHYWTRRSSSSCLRLCLWVLLNIVDARLCLNQTQTRTIDSRSDPRIYTSQLPAFQRVYTQSTASHPHQQALLIASHPDRSQRWRAGLICLPAIPFPNLGHSPRYQGPAHDLLFRGRFH